MKTSLRHIITLLAVAILLATATGCGSRNHTASEEQQFDRARNDARHWAAQLAATSRQDTAAMQQCILEAKAAQAKYINTDDPSIADEMITEFDNAYREYLEENAPELARELFP
ncbi:MAG: hypothetical protein IJ835_05965 [Muribaculaceae bacterium]|nr:hypothetical protein [Muribaculaceae bacterium]